jgi:hypothetical protein
MRVRLAQPAENLPANRVGKRFVNRVDVERHWGGFHGLQQQAGAAPVSAQTPASLRDELYIVFLRYA